MLRRRPVGVAVQRLLAGGFPQEYEQLRHLVTASQLLQQSLAAWCAQATRDSRIANTYGDQAVGGTLSAIHAASGVQYITRASYHTTSATAAGTRQSIADSLAKKQQKQQLQQRLQKLEQQVTQQNTNATPPEKQEQTDGVRQIQNKQQSLWQSTRARDNRQASHHQQQQQQVALQAYITHMEKQQKQQTVEQTADTTDTSASAGDVAAVAVDDLAGHSRRDAKITKMQQQVVTWDSSLLPSLVSSLLAADVSSTSSSGSSGCPSLSPELQQAVEQWRWYDEQSAADNEGLDGLIEEEAWWDADTRLSSSHDPGVWPLAVGDQQQVGQEQQQQQQQHAGLEVFWRDLDDDASAAPDAWADGPQWQFSNNSQNQQHLLQDRQQTLQQEDGLCAEQQQQLTELTCHHQQGDYHEDAAEPLAGDGDAWERDEADTRLMQQQQQKKKKKKKQDWHTGQSQPYTVAAAAAGLYWPGYINNVLLAIQYGTVHLQAGYGPGSMLGQVDTGSSSGGSSSDNCGGNGGSSTAAVVHEDDCQEDSFAWMYSSSSSSSADGGLQLVVDGLHDPWRFEVPYNSSTSPEQTEPQQPQSAVADHQDTFGPRVLDWVWDFLAGFLGVDTKHTAQQSAKQQQQQQQDEGVLVQQTTPSATPEATADTVTGVTSASAPAVTAGPVTAPTQSRQASLLVPPQFELQPLGHPRYSEGELVMLQKVTNMARGTALEAALWSEISNAPVHVTSEGLEVPGCKRIRLFRTTSTPQQRQQQQQSNQHQASLEVATAQQQKEAQARSYLSELAGKGELPGLHWFVPLAVAAFQAARAAGWRPSEAVTVPPGHTEPGTIRELYDAQHQQQALPDAAAAGVVSSSRHGGRQDQGCNFSDSLKQAIRASQDISKLLGVWQSYPHYWPQHPAAVAVMVEKASELWAAPAATQETSYRLEQLIADTFISSEQGSEPDMAATAAAAADEDTTDSADSDAVVSAVLSGVAQEPQTRAAAELFTSLVDWYTGQHVRLQRPPRVDLLSPLRLAKPGSSSSSNGSGKHACGGSLRPAEPKQVAQQLVQLFTVAVTSSGGGGGVLQPLQESLPIPRLTSALTAGLSHLGVPELLDLYFTLMEWDKLSRWDGEEQRCAAKLYQAVVKQLAMRQQHQQQFDQELLRLLEVAHHACAASIKHATGLYQGHLEVKAVPCIMLSEAYDAAAAGYLQQVAGMAAPQLRQMANQQQRQQQQRPALPEGLRMENLVPQLFELLQAAAATSGKLANRPLHELASSIATYLITPQQHESSAAGGSRLQVPLSLLPTRSILDVVAALHSMRQESSAAAVASAVCQTKVTSSLNRDSTDVSLLHSFTSEQMSKLIYRNLLKGPDLEILAAAAAHRAQIVTNHLSRGSSSSSSLAMSGLSVPAVDDLVSEVDSLHHIMRRYYREEMYYPMLLDALGALLEASVGCAEKTLTPESFVGIASSLAKFNHCSRHAAEAVQECASALLPSCTGFNVARLAWALAVLDQRDVTLWRNIKKAIAKTNAAMPILYQPYLFVRYHVPALGTLLSADKAALTKSSWEQVTASVSVSQLQRDVSHVISALQAQPQARVHRYELELRTELSSADILVKVGDHDVVVEVDGPLHYARNDKYWRLGSSELRDLLLAAAGYRVLPMPYFVWEVFKRMSEADRLWQLNKMLHQVAEDGTILWQTAEWCKRYNIPHTQLIKSCRPTIAAQAK